MNPWRRPPVLFAAAVVALAVGVGCSDAGDGGGASPQLGGTLAPSQLGDACTDPTGDLSADVKAAGGSSEPAGADLVEASARVEDDVLAVRFVTAGDIDQLVRPLFVVGQGDLGLAPQQSFELRVGRGESGAWALTVLTLADGRQRETPLLVPVTVEGSELRYDVDLAGLPRIETLLWLFGTSAETTLEGDAEPSRVIDECASFLESPGSTGGSSGPGTTADGGAADATGEDTAVSGLLGEARQLPGGGTVTVHAVAFPAAPTRPPAAPVLDGRTLAAVDVEVCAPASEPVQGGGGLVTVRVADGAVVSSWSADQPVEPALPDQADVPAGSCIRGWVSFEVAAGTPVAEVFYAAGAEPLSWVFGG
ncbi:MAG: hypothetical protein MUF83_00775 [Acidimicrobiales bacterium]|nr:hypothetical protein [Acidimicrobiales bacterium]